MLIANLFQPLLFFFQYTTTLSIHGLTPCPPPHGSTPTLSLHGSTLTFSLPGSIHTTYPPWSTLTLYLHDPTRTLSSMGQHMLFLTMFPSLSTPPFTLLPTVKVYQPELHCPWLLQSLIQSVSTISGGGAGCLEFPTSHNEVFLVTESLQSSLILSRWSRAYLESPVYCNVYKY